MSPAIAEPRHTARGRTAAAGRGGTAAAALCVVSCAALALPAAAPAQERRAAMPFSEVAPHVDGDAVVVVVLGSAADADGPIAARRLSARSSARTRAVALLHGFVDDALARVAISPADLAAAHAAVDAGADLRRVRSLVDGSALVEVSVPLATLRVAVDREGLPW